MRFRAVASAPLLRSRWPDEGDDCREAKEGIRSDTAHTKSTITPSPVSACQTVWRACLLVPLFPAPAGGCFFFFFERADQRTAVMAAQPCRAAVVQLAPAGWSSCRLCVPLALAPPYASCSAAPCSPLLPCPPLFRPLPTAYPSCRFTSPSSIPPLQFMRRSLLLVALDWPIG